MKLAQSRGGGFESKHEISNIGRLHATMTARSKDAQNIKAVNLESQPPTSLPSYDSDEEDMPVQAIPARSRSPNTHARQQSREPLLLPISVDSRSSRRGLEGASSLSNAFQAIKETFQANLGFMLACGASICFCLINVFVAIFSTSGMLALA